jgi:hypothetical protein
VGNIKMMSDVGSKTGYVQSVADGKRRAQVVNERARDSGCWLTKSGNSVKIVCLACIDSQ